MFVANRSQEQTEVLERGNIYFMYRPRVRKEGKEKTVENIRDVERTYMVLEPEGGRKRYRLLIIGQKKLPEIQDGGQKFWGFVDKVADKAEDVEDELDKETYDTETRGERERPAARPAGEGVYKIVRHEDHMHLTYALELPEQPNDVQSALNIEDEGSYIFSVKNPEKSSPPEAGLQEEQKADFPEHLQEKFHGRRFVGAEPEFLDYSGTEILLIGAKENPEKELGISLNPEKETLDTAEIFSDLRMERSQHPVKPLIKGKWA